MRFLLLAVVLLGACASSPDTSPARTTVPEGSVVVVAAGDIACPPTLAETCTDTSRLVESLRPQAVLALGDLQYERGELANFQAVYDRTWGRFKSITHPAPGNHEYSTPQAAGYFDYFQVQPWYSVEVGAWHVVSLNSNCGPAGGCQAGSPQERWLRADLAAHPAKCTLAFWHHPRYSSGYHGADTSMEDLWQALADAGADVVLSGHDHHYERFAPQRGVRQFVAGTGGRSLYPAFRGAAGSEAVNDDTYGVLKLTLHPSSYDWEFVPAADADFSDRGHTDCR